MEQQILKAIHNGRRVTTEEALWLYEKASLSFISEAAMFVRKRLNDTAAFYNRNFHIEPTNICVYECSFCAFSRKPGEEGGWETSLEEVEKIVRSYDGHPVTEVHIVGGVHPKRGVEYYGEMLRLIKRIRPTIHIKAFTAVELKVIFARSKLNSRDGLLALKEAGLDSIPGGGAEIFADEIRRKICPTKATAEEWLSIHQTAHELGIHSNCTMLYGHIERYEHRIDHMERLRTLQDKTAGFNCFIPLKFRHENNLMADVVEASAEEDLKNYGVSRIFLDNIRHLKAYWPMIGRKTAAASLSFGVDDLDGTIDDTTKIYSMAGSEEQAPKMSTVELQNIISAAGFLPTERDSLYNRVTT